MITSIGVFGKRNVGKSSLMNIILGQEFAIVSDNPGTTTDPVRKRMEIAGIGRVEFIDTAGIDDLGDLGEKRVLKTKEIVDQVDIALFVFTSNFLSKEEKAILEILKIKKIPSILVHNQSDITSLLPEIGMELTEYYGVDVLEFSCKISNIDEKAEALELLIAFLLKVSLQNRFREKSIFEGIIAEGENVVLVCPIDSAAPTGRLILPQTMAIRDLLDRVSTAIVLTPESLPDYLKNNQLPSLVVTDSQVFQQIATIVPETIPLTSFSMLLARANGCFEEYVAGTSSISGLKDGAHILILESCTHHTSCEDIGRVKLPRLFEEFTKKKLHFDVVSGLDRIEKDIKEYDLVVQCGGCMITPRQLYSRLSPALEHGIPITNYGMAISYMSGIFDRTIAPLI